MKIDLERLKKETVGPGKFEGEGPETVYYWELSGEGEILETNEHSGSGCELFDVDDDERKAFGFEPEVCSFLVEWDSQGFVTGWPMEAGEDARMRKRVEHDRRETACENLEDCLQVDVHQERGEIHVMLRAFDESIGLDHIVAHWPDCADLFDDGFLDGRDAILGKFHRERTGKLLASAKEYATSLGLIKACKAEIRKDGL